MKRTVLAVILLLSLGVSIISAQSFTVEYVDGFLYRLTGNGWTELYIGDALTSQDSIRLDDNSYAQLQGWNLSLSITEPGVYRIEYLLAAQNERTAIGIGTMVADKLKYFLGGLEMDSQIGMGAGRESRAVVGGVRAAEAETESAIDLDWSESDTVELIAESRHAISEGKLDVALSLLEEAYLLALDDLEETEALFYRGYVLLLKGENAPALEALTALSPNIYSETYHSHILLVGNLYSSSFAYGTAIEWFDRYSPDRATYRDPESEQMIYLLAGMAHKQKGSISRAKEWLEKAVELDSGSGAAEAAGELLKEL